MSRNIDKKNIKIKIKINEKNEDEKSEENSQPSFALQSETQCLREKVAFYENVFERSKVSFDPSSSPSSPLNLSTGRFVSRGGNIVSRDETDSNLVNKSNILDYSEIKQKKFESRPDTVTYSTNIITNHTRLIHSPSPISEDNHSSSISTTDTSISSSLDCNSSAQMEWYKTSNFQQISTNLDYFRSRSEYDIHIKEFRGTLKHL